MPSNFNILDAGPAVIAWTPLVATDGNLALTVAKANVLIAAQQALGKAFWHLEHVNTTNFLLVFTTAAPPGFAVKTEAMLVLATGANLAAATADMNTKIAQQQLAGWCVQRVLMSTTNNFILCFSRKL